jgi:DNA-binding NarL/FixJ family response regulator
MKILMVEDNFAIGEPIRDEIQRAFGSAVWLETESDFRVAWDDIAANPPRAAVIDVMLKWDILRREKRVRPPEAANMYLAGVRCAEMLLTDARTKDVPIVLFSVRDRADLATELDCLKQMGSVTYLQKSSEPSQLISLLRQLIGASHRGGSTGRGSA